MGAYSGQSTIFGIGVGDTRGRLQCGRPMQETAVWKAAVSGPPISGAGYRVETTVPDVIVLEATARGPPIPDRDGITGYSV